MPENAALAYTREWYVPNAQFWTRHRVHLIRELYSDVTSSFFFLLAIILGVLAFDCAVDFTTIFTSFYTAAPSTSTRTPTLTATSTPSETATLTATNTQQILQRNTTDTLRLPFTVKVSSFGCVCDQSDGCSERLYFGDDYDG